MAVGVDRAMTRDQAQREAERLNEEHAGGTDRWFARAHDDEWSVVKLSGLPRALVGPLKATVEAKPRPPQPDDPRPNVWRDVGGPWGL